MTAPPTRESREAATYAIGFGVAAAYLAPAGFTDAEGDPAESLA